MVEIVPFPHGYDDLQHCWAQVYGRLAGDDHACRRRVCEVAYARVGVDLCTQHYEQVVRSGLRICRMPRELLERLIRDLDREAEETLPLGTGGDAAGTKATIVTTR
jgi:hypothetical protein